MKPEDECTEKVLTRILKFVKCKKITGKVEEK